MNVHMFIVASVSGDGKGEGRRGEQVLGCANKRGKEKREERERDREREEREI